LEEETVQLPTYINMGRGGHDTTDPGNPKSAMAAEVLKHESDKKKVQEVCARGCQGHSSKLTGVL
jgi:hypothetical protein